ncbi:uncharacterized protein UV8b_07510 [Ustilaginoidea virens]|uniref:Uncharacterized protein n=1 Tax=Ustilaginoidea virens TaxID=1159556 RepID=A0A8E5HX68_USTVR|nr:uncharacterized protein UV8b_07510 [Ustilaginoidea virens]QUC23269.1 hypothetical protein UV8b_07510 [Ustilaginoidea virens]
MKLPAILASVALLSAPAFATPVDAQNVASLDSAPGKSYYSCSVRAADGKMTTVRISSVLAKVQAAVGGIDAAGVSGYPKKYNPKWEFEDSTCDKLHVELLQYPLYSNGKPFHKNEKNQPDTPFKTIYTAVETKKGRKLHFCGVGYGTALCTLNKRSRS